MPLQPITAREALDRRSEDARISLSDLMALLGPETPPPLMRKKRKKKKRTSPIKKSPKKRSNRTLMHMR